MEKEIFTKSKVGNAFTLATISTATTTYGAWIDTFGYNSLLMTFLATFTTGEISAIVIQGADVASSYSDAAATSDDNVLYAPDDLPNFTTGYFAVGSVCKKRYQRIGITSANYSASVNFTLQGTYALSDSFAQPDNSHATIETAASLNVPGAIADGTATFPKI